MDTEQLKQLLKDRVIVDFNSIEQDFERGLRLILRDDTGEMGLLTVGPCVMALPDEVLLDYSYSIIESPVGPPPEECLVTDFKPRVGPDYERGEVPFLFD